MNILKSKALWLSLGVAFLAIFLTERVEPVRKLIKGA